MHINPNIFYRITNVALGTSFSLDVQNPKTIAPGVTAAYVDVAASNAFNGQVWQFLNPSVANKGPYYMASSFLGAQKKLDISIGSNHTYIPMLKDLTMAYNQTWWLIPHNDTSLNATTYSLAPLLFRGTKALSVDSATMQPCLDVASGNATNQRWVLTPVMQVNDPTFSTAAFLAMAGASSTTAASTKSTGLPESTSSSFHGKIAMEYRINKPTLIIIVVAPVTFVLALLMLTSMFIMWRRGAARQQRKPASIIDRKLQSAWRDSVTQVNVGITPSQRKPGGRIYTPSITSWTEPTLPAPMKNEFISPLEPRPPSRPASWIRGRDNRPFFGAPALGSNLEAERMIQSPISPLLPAELPAGSRRGSAIDLIDVSPLSPFMGSQRSYGITSPKSTTMQRQTSLISRWKI